MKRHLKRINMPKFWHIGRKESKFVARPMPGAHKIDRCITAALLLKEFLKYAKINREVKYILNGKKLFVDKKAVKEPRFPIGLMDIVEISEIGEHYRVMIDNKGCIKLNKITKDEANTKLCRIIGKTMLKKGKIQINLIDGKNIIADKDGYNVGDTVVFDLVAKKIKKLLKLEKGSMVILTDGNHVGKIGVVEKINKYGGMREPTITFKHEGNEFETLKEYCYVIDKEHVKEIKNEGN